MRDFEVRSALLTLLESAHAGDGSLIVNELGLRQGDTRVDVAVVNGELSGYEIKSAADTLQRFPHQQDLYSQVLDRAWLVSTSKKIDQVASTLPPWWGVMAIEDAPVHDSGLTTVRAAEMNPGHNPMLVAMLLWRSEVIDLLARRDALKGHTSKPRADLWRRLVEVYPLDELRGAVRSALKARSAWRADRRRSRGGVRCPVGARSLASPAPPTRPRIVRCTCPQD